MLPQFQRTISGLLGGAYLFERERSYKPYITMGANLRLLDLQSATLTTEAHYQRVYQLYTFKDSIKSYVIFHNILIMNINFFR